MNQENRPIKILNKSYQLPTIASEKLETLQQQIKNRQAIIKTGEIEETVIVRKQVEIGGFLGLGKRTKEQKIQQKRRKRLDVEARFQALEAQIQDYDQLMAFLQSHKVAYQRFFVELSEEIKGVIRQKCVSLQQVEQRRQAFEQRATEKQNQNLQYMAREQKRQLLESLTMLDKAAILMLKKIEFISAGIEKLTADNEVQKKLLKRLMDELHDHREAVAIQREINRLQADIAEITDVALNFESYLEKYLGPFQSLVNDAAQVDQDLARNVEEIRGLAEDLLNQEGAFSLRGADQISESLLEFSVRSYSKQEHLSEALDNAQSLSTGVYPWSVAKMSAAELDKTSVDQSIGKLQEKMSGKLQQITQAIIIDLDVASQTQQTKEEAERERQAALQRERELYLQRLKQYEGEFERAVKEQYPLEPSVRATLDQQWQDWGLDKEDIRQREQAITKKIITRQIETEYQIRLKQREREIELERQRTEAIQQQKRLAEEEAKKAEAEYQIKLKQQKQEIELERQRTEAIQEQKRLAEEEAKKVETEYQIKLKQQKQAAETERQRLEINHEQKKSEPEFLKGLMSNIESDLHNLFKSEPLSPGKKQQNNKQQKQKTNSLDLSDLENLFKFNQDQE